MIRELRQDDDLIPLLTEWQRETRGDLFGMGCIIEITERHLKEMIGKENHKVFVSVKEGNIVGLMGVRIYKSAIGDELFAGEHLWFVSRIYRGLRSMKLLRYVMEWAKSKGCSHFVSSASNLSSELHDSICSLYEDIGMVKFETSYIGRLT